MSTVKTFNLQHPSSSTVNMTLASDGSVSGNLPTGGRNRIINGGFDVWQRGTSIAFAGTAYQYMSDRWKVVRGAFATGMTVSQQATGLTGFRWCSRVQRDSGNTSGQYLEMMQTLETSEAIKLAGTTVVFSFYARAGANYSSASNALGFYAFYGTGTDQSNENFTGRTAILAQTATLTTSWQRFSGTATVPATATGVSFGFSYTPTGTAGAADYYDITGVQLEVGTAATPFEFKPYAQELRDCQRYYCRLGTDSSSPYGNIGVGSPYSGTNGLFHVQLPVEMRIPPTSLSWNALQIMNYGTSQYAVTDLSISGNRAGKNAVLVNPTSSGLSIGQFCFLAANNSGNGYIAFNAEL